MNIKIKDWKKFQHYKDRKPLWIKLYRDLLDDIEFFSLSGEGVKLLIMIWLIASEDSKLEGNLPAIRELAFRLRTTEEKILNGIPELSHWLIVDDSDGLAGGSQGASPETEKRQRKDRDREEIDAPVDHQNEYDGEKETLAQRVVAVVMESFSDWPQSEVEASVLKFHVAEAGLTLDEWRDIASAAWKATPPKTPVRAYHQKLSWQMDFHLRQRKARADADTRETPQQRERREQLEQAKQRVIDAEKREQENGNGIVCVEGRATVLGGISQDEDDNGQAPTVGTASGGD